MSDPAPRLWHLYIDDMIAFGDKVMAYTRGLDQDAFVGNGLVFDATLRNLELIGEAATHVPQTSALPTRASHGGESSRRVTG